jgi:CRISPR/Cas system Type II protein with McrA/HNH and RuvC-like nuclease domain
MGKILGIDLGTNSAGWTIIDSVTNEIIETGVRIFPEGVNKDKSGTESPKNLERRVARGIRKNNFRYKLRRNKLNRILSELGMTPDSKYFTNEKNRNYTNENGGKIKIKHNFTFELYELRDKALNQKITLSELGRIFFHFNTHRGFKSNAKEKAIIEFTTNETRKEAQGKVEKSYSDLQKKINETKEKGFIKYGTIGEYFFYLIKQNKESHNINAPISKIRNNDNQEGHYTLRKMYEDEFDLIWEKQKVFHNNNTVFNNENKIKIKDETIFYQRDLRSSKHLIARCPLEFKPFYKTEKGKQIIEKSYLPCCSKSSLLFQQFRIWDTLNNLRYKSDDGDWESLNIEQKTLFANILEFEDSVYINVPDNRTKLEKGRRVEIEKQKKELFEKLLLPTNAIFNINKILGNRTVYRLATALGKDFWENKLVNDIKIDNLKLINEFVNPDTGEIIKYPESLNYTVAQQNLWHIIDFSSNFTNSQDWILGRVSKKNNNHTNTFKQLKLTLEQINKYSSLVFEPDYASYSSKAISKLLPFLKAGFELHQAEEIIYSKINSDIRTNDNNLLDEVPLLPNNYLRNPIVQQGANETIRLINSIIEKNKSIKPDEIRIEFTRELKKPKEAREQQKRNNDAKEAERKKYADFLSKKLNQFVAQKDSRIEKFEFWLELAWSKKAFDEIKEDILLKDFEEFCKDIDNTKIKDYEKKYQLWLECGRILPYTNEVIGLGKLLSSEIEIEHIIPYSRCYDDSFMNKTLSTRSFNNKKGKLTPVEYFDNVSKKEFNEFKKRIKDFPEAKRKRFLLATDKIDGFKNNQLNNTAYVTTVLFEHLRKTFKADQIKITNGAITSIMRSIFGFNTLLNSPIKAEGYENGPYWAVFDTSNQLFTLTKKINNEVPEFDKEYTVVSSYINNEYLRIKKTRNDHRHHAVDAIAIAFTNQRMIQFISTITEGYFEKDGTKVPDNTEGATFISAFDENSKFTKKVWDAILAEAKKHYDIKSIRTKAKDKIVDILISHKADNKLTSSGRKKVYTPSGKRMKIKDKEGKDIEFYSGGNVARGALHESSIYGKTKNLKENEFVKRVKVGSLTWSQILSIVDTKIKSILIKDVAIQAKNIFEKDLQSNPSTIKPFKSSFEELVEIDMEKILIEEQLEIMKEIEDLNEHEKILKKELIKKLNALKGKLNDDKEIGKNNKNKTYKSYLEKGFKEAMKNGFFLENEGKRKRKLKDKINNEVIRKPIPIKKVRVKIYSSSMVNYKSDIYNRKAFVEPGENYCIAIYGDIECQARDFESVTFLKAAQITAMNKKLIQQNKPVISLYNQNKNGLKFLQTLSKGDAVLVYKEHPDELDLKNIDKEFLFKRLFKVIKSDKNGKIILGRHNLSNIKADKDKPINDLDSVEGSVIRWQYSTIKCIKVEVDLLGNIKLA